MKSKESKGNKRRSNFLQVAPANYLIVCEGKQTEPNYFNGLKQEINKKYGNKVEVLIPNIDIKGTGMNTTSLVKYTQKIINYSHKIYGQVWVVFDKDDYTDDQFNNAIKLNEYNSAWSNPNFEVWLLSHFKKVSNPLSKNNSLKELKKEFQNANLGNYSKNDKEIFEKVTKDNRLETAIQNCKEIYEQFKTTSSEASKNPCTTVFMLVEDLSEYLK